jgi:hypothetical protein
MFAQEKDRFRRAPIKAKTKTKSREAAI